MATINVYTGKTTVEFVLNHEDFENYLEFLTFNQTRLSVSFKQPDGGYIGLSKRRENSITEMTFELGEKPYSFTIEQSSVGDLIDYLTEHNPKNLQA